jgi:hypothetical protein
MTTWLFSPVVLWIIFIFRIFKKLLFPLIPSVLNLLSLSVCVFVFGCSSYLSHHRPKKDAYLSTHLPIFQHFQRIQRNLVMVMMLCTVMVKKQNILSILPHKTSRILPLLGTLSNKLGSSAMREKIVLFSLCFVEEHRRDHIHSMSLNHFSSNQTHHPLIHFTILWEKISHCHPRLRFTALLAMYVLNSTTLQFSMMCIFTYILMKTHTQSHSLSLSLYPSRCQQRSLRRQTRLSYLLLPLKWSIVVFWKYLFFIQIHFIVV